MARATGSVTLTLVGRAVIDWRESRASPQARICDGMGLAKKISARAKPGETRRARIYAGRGSIRRLTPPRQELALQLPLSSERDGTNDSETGECYRGRLGHLSDRHIVDE